MPQRFAEAACPFTVEIPAPLKLDADSPETISYDADGKLVSASWSGRDTEVMLMCTGNLQYRLDEGYEENTCSATNPNLVVGSICGRTQKFGGVEVAFPTDDPAAGVKYFSLYVGHKEGKGKVTLRVASTRSSVDETERKRIDLLADTIYATIR
ncbi:hypothetical protein E2F50_04560 [Rhizobium deserti]|uniref:Uncharacterized protein n=1 Tax=Rhizobium deserti TaxID=2547961 RepID=A0A4R5UNA0_9HYPH|nr:hypothetical protein [Rhizobium deserti]TDK39393.1 hypothetical protein E2F50_04560 [Rhizobium deserti]